jgi:acyloxyacyl hydrolase
VSYPAINGDPWWKKVLDQLIAPFVNTFDLHVPLDDIDGDHYSIVETFRGSAWRGKDCDDKSNSVYPGRKFNNATDDARKDNNCNGIYGIDPVSGKSYEDLFCTGTGQLGVAVLGDSASAHFRIPPQFVTADTINKETYSHFLRFASLEADWPHLSTITGFTEDTTGLVPGPTHSIYKMLKERNRCIHRDYQNIAVNGARTGAMQKISLTLSRNQATDHPLLLFYSLVGNDVCSPHQTTDTFTKPEVFYQNVVGTLDHLEQVLPAGSFVVFVGLAPGGVLYDILKDRYHPLGIKYPQMYDYLNCLGCSPCWGWMNSNATIRNETSKAAEALSQVYSKIIADKQNVYKNFKMIYHEFPLKDILEHYPGPVSDLIEPMDGFHPSQIAISLVADYMFDYLSKNYPETVGKVNPHNAEIIKLFGDQGGY